MAGSTAPPSILASQKVFFIIGKFSCKNTKFGAGNPPFGGKFMGQTYIAKLNFEQSACLLNLNFAVVCRRIATSLPAPQLF